MKKKDNTMHLILGVSIVGIVLVTILLGLAASSLSNAKIESPKVSGNVSTASIIDAQVTFTNFNDEYDLPLGSEKLKLVVSSALLDSNQNVVKNSTSELDLIKATLFDTDKNILDYGSIQNSFYVTTGQRGMLTFSGTVEVLLDDVPKGKRYLSYHGPISNDGRVKLNVDKESKLLADRTNSLTFTLADEGKGWKDGELHRLVIKAYDIKGQILQDGKSKLFEHYQDFIIYQIEMIVDNEKYVTFDENHQAISVFRADSTFTLCGENKITVKFQGTPEQYVESVSPGVKIFIKDETVPLLDLPPAKSCSTYTGIPRSSLIKIVTSDNKSFEIITPKTKADYNISCYIGWQSATAFSQGYAIYPCNSNVGYKR